jgi:hypothetical protein
MIRALKSEGDVDMRLLICVTGVWDATLALRKDPPAGAPASRPPR